MNIAELSFTHYTQTIVTLNTTFLKHELQGLKVSLPVCCATIYLVYREWNFDAFFIFVSCTLYRHFVLFIIYRCSQSYTNYILILFSHFIHKYTYNEFTAVWFLSVEILISNYCSDRALFIKGTVTRDLNPNFWSQK